ncbi:hypothetical protein ONS96_000468 [Cadophora gregata f. sp. sojae]|nr:hypothetical protein ONS96_000468 [Cadophora gregata f. sp. sojae]
MCRQWQGALVIEIYKAEIQPNLPKPKEVSQKLSCNDAAGIIAEWMAACESYVECQDPVSNKKYNYTGTRHVRLHITNVEIDLHSSYLKRLIWLGPNLEFARLVPFPPDVVQYAALSYCFVVHLLPASVY